MSSINYTATINTMGEATDAEAHRYVAALESALSEEFPGADIRVTRNDRISNSQIVASDDIDTELVREVANRVWNAGDWI